MYQRSYKTMTSLFVLYLVLSLGSCVSLNQRYAASLAVKPGATVEIKSSLEIPSGLARVYLQSGKPVKKNKLDRFEVYCSVLMNRVHDSGEPLMAVRPGLFRVKEVLLYNDYNTMRRSYVSLGWSFDFPSDVIYEIGLQLESSEQPEVRALICAKHVDNYRSDQRNYPDLGEIQTALGDLIGFP